MDIQGKKTYAVGILVLIIGLIAKYFKIIDGQTLMILISMAALIMGLKSGQSKIQAQM